MGLPVKHFVAGTNVNDTVPRFLQSGAYEPKPSVQTLANAMDVGNPSNWVRIQDLFDNELEKLRGFISSYTYTDAQTKDASREFFDKYIYVACPHTAFAYLEAKAYNADNPGEYASIFLSTAHPCKFPEGIDADIFEKVIYPAGAEALAGKPKLADSLAVSYEDFNFYLLNNK